MDMNEINLVLQKFPSINREELLTLTDALLCYLYNKCPKSLASLKAKVDKWCSDTMPIPNYYLMGYKEIVESEIKKYLKKEYVNYFYEKSDDWEINETKKIFLDTFSLLGNLSRY
jgi:hypothetical protein